MQTVDSGESGQAETPATESLADGPRSGGQILVDQLVELGMDHAFCVPGESYLPVLDALRSHAQRVRLITCRHESSAANMAEAYGKLTGQPGICFVTRAPGAMHAAVGLHTAFQDATPMILFVGQVPRGHQERDAFQELDYRRVFGTTTKWATQLDDATRIPEYLGRAFSVACSGRPGPVVIALPEDVLWEQVAVDDVGPLHLGGPHPGVEEMSELRGLLAASKRPMVLIGGGGWSAGAHNAMGEFVRTSNLPTVTGFRCQDYVDNDLAQYVGTLGFTAHPALAQRMRDADTLLVVGERLGDMTTRGYQLLEPPQPLPTLVHVLPDAEELGRVYRPTLGIAATSEAFTAALRSWTPLDSAAWDDWTAQGRAEYLDTRTETPGRGSVDLYGILTYLRERLPDDAIITNGAGNYTAWVHRFSRFRTYPSQLAPRSGAMGYGVPAALTAKLLYPDRMVIAFAGDGCFLMAGQELATAVREGLAVVFVVINNSAYGTIRMHQERRFPHQPYGVSLTNPDFVAYARAFGAHAEAVVTTAQFPDAFERALASGKTALLEVVTDPDQILPHLTLDDVRTQGPQRDG